MIAFIDANIIAKAFSNNADRQRCRDVLNEEFVTNTLCLIEAQHALSVIKNDKSYAADCIKSLFKGKGVIVQLDKNLLFDSIKRIEKHNLNAFDMVHYVTALLYNCTEIVSYDRDFDGLEIKRVEP